MSALKPRYVEAFGLAMLEEINAAQALPDLQARGAASEVAGMELRNVYAVDARRKWQMLKGYIEGAYGNHVKPMLEDAGWGHYGEALKNNWEELGELMVRGAVFLADAGKVADLMAGDNMPGSFVGVFGAAKDGFDAQYLLFMGLLSGQPMGTVEKLEANNALFRKTMRLSKDAPLALPGEPSRYHGMVYNRAVRLVESPRTKASIE